MKFLSEFWAWRVKAGSWHCGRSTGPRYYPKALRPSCHKTRSLTFYLGTCKCRTEMMMILHHVKVTRICQGLVLVKEGDQTGPMPGVWSTPTLPPMKNTGLGLKDCRSRVRLITYMKHYQETIEIVCKIGGNICASLDISHLQKTGCRESTESRAIACQHIVFSVTFFNQREDKRLKIHDLVKIRLGRISQATKSFQASFWNPLNSTKFPLNLNLLCLLHTATYRYTGTQ